jgi:hypothetical protein
MKHVNAQIEKRAFHLLCQTEELNAALVMRFGVSWAAATIRVAELQLGVVEEGLG